MVLSSSKYTSVRVISGVALLVSVSLLHAIGSLLSISPDHLLSGLPFLSHSLHNAVVSLSTMYTRQMLRPFLLDDLVC